MSSDPSKAVVLPPDWIRVKSSAAAPGRDYFFNTKNKKSVWTIHEALRNKNNRPPRRAYMHHFQDPQPPTEPDNEESSGSEEVQTATKKPTQGSFPQPMMSYTNPKEMMYNQGMWMPNSFNPQFMPFNSAMPMMTNPWAFQNMMFANPMNAGFNQFAQMNPNVNIFPVNVANQQSILKNVQDADPMTSNESKEKPKPIQSEDLRHKIEAKKKQRRHSLVEERKPIMARRASCSDINSSADMSKETSMECSIISTDVTEDSTHNVEDDDNVPLNAESYGFWLLKQSKLGYQENIVYICVDTNIFITKLDLITRLIDMDKENICKILVPQCVTVELDSISKRISVERSGEGAFGGMYGGSYPLNRRRLAKTANDYLLTMFEKNDQKFISDYDESSEDDPNYLVKRYNTDDNLINCCRKYTSKKIHTILLTQDKNLRMRAISCNVCVYSIQQIETLLDNVQEEIENRDVFLKKVKVVVPNVQKNNSAQNNDPGFREFSTENAQNTYNDESKGQMEQNLSAVLHPAMYSAQNTGNFGPMMFTNMPMASNGMPILQHYDPMGFNNVQLMTMANMCQPKQANLPGEKNQATRMKLPQPTTNLNKASCSAGQISNNVELTTSKSSADKTNPISSTKSSSANKNDNKSNNVEATPGKKIKLIRNRFNNVTKTKEAETVTTQDKSNTGRVVQNQKGQSKTGSPNKGVQVSVSSTSTHYPSFTTTSARSKEIVNMSLESSFQNEFENEQEMRHEDFAERAVIFDKLHLRMDEWTTQLELILVETLTNLLLSENRFYNLPPPWSLYEVLCTLSKRCQRENKRLSDVANHFAEIVHKSYTTCSKNEKRKNVQYTKLTPKGPETFLELYNESRKLLGLLKETYGMREIFEADELLDLLMEELKGSALENEIELISSPGITDEIIETVNEEDCKESEVKCNEDKRMRVLIYLKQHFEQWKDFDVTKLQKKAAQGEGVALTDKTHNKKSKSENRPKTAEKKDDKTIDKNKNVSVEPVIIRTFSVKIPEFESRLNEINNSKDWNYCDEEYEEYDENFDGEEYNEAQENEDAENEFDYEEFTTGERTTHEKNTEFHLNKEKVEKEINYLVQNDKENIGNNKTDNCSVENRKTIKGTDVNSLEEEMDFEYDEVIDRVEMEPAVNGFSEKETTKKQICPVAHAIERSISNCFAFASQQFKNNLGLDTPQVTGDASGMPKLPEILEHIQIFAQCLEELLNSDTCDALLLRTSINKLAPKVSNLPKQDSVLIKKCVRLIEKVSFETLKKEVNFLQETHSVLKKFYQDHC